MRITLSFVLYILSICCFAQSSSEIIGTPIKRYNFEIAQFKFPNKMNFYEAEKSCRELGLNWRLPTATELKIILSNPHEKEYFKSKYDETYWASSCNPKYLGCDTNYSYVVNNRNDFQFGVYYPTNQINKVSKELVIAVRNDSSSLINLTAKTTIDSIIGKPKKIGNIEIAQFDLPHTNDMNWYISQERCRNLGKGWRLPTLKEMTIINKNIKIIGNISEYDYWTYTAVETEADFSFIYQVNKSNWKGKRKSSSDPLIRAVRYVPTSIIGTPLKLGNLLIAQNSFEEDMTWIDAVNVCAGLGEGWRLPTIDELDFLHKNSSKITKSKKIDANDYWSSSNDTDINMVFLKNLIDGSVTNWLKYYDTDPNSRKTKLGNIIAVKSIK